MTKNHTPCELGGAWGAYLVRSTEGPPPTRCTHAPCTAQFTRVCDFSLFFLCYADGFPDLWGLVKSRAKYSEIVTLENIISMELV